VYVLSFESDFFPFNICTTECNTSHVDAVYDNETKQHAHRFVFILL